MIDVVFCDNKETIQHIFFDCHVARFVWRVFTMAFGLQPPIRCLIWSVVSTNRPAYAFSNLHGDKCNFMVYLAL
jgi:hypothetical protein